MCIRDSISPYVNTASLHYLRFPGGSTNTVSRRYGGRGVMVELKQQCAEKGYAYVDWNVCAEDAVGGKPSAGTIYRNVVREDVYKRQLLVWRIQQIAEKHRLRIQVRSGKKLLRKRPVQPCCYFAQ